MKKTIIIISMIGSLFSLYAKEGYDFMAVARAEGKGEACASRINMYRGSGQDISTPQQILNECEICASNAEYKAVVVEACLNKFGLTLKK